MKNEKVTRNNARMAQPYTLLVVGWFILRRWLRSVCTFKGEQ